ncbi:MAG: transporter [Flavobacteriaceae bacterium]
MGQRTIGKLCKGILLFLILNTPFTAFSQYTEVINSNRPGESVSAYAVGKNVVQAEFGGYYERQDHSGLSTNSNIYSADLALRYGLLFESLEIIWEGSYLNEDIKYTAFDLEESKTDFAVNRLGLKYLLYDPYKNPERNKPNIRSWRANNKFQWKNLIPAVSVYGGANFVLGDNPFYVEDPTVSPRVMLATQSQLTPKSVLILNFIYDRIGTDFPEMSYVISFSRAFRNPKWSACIENQGISSDRYSDILLRTGVSHLFSRNFQVDLGLGGNFKTSPSRYFGTLGLSYRLDFHQDQLISTEVPGGAIRKNSMKKNKSSDIGPSKSDIRKQRKKAKKNKKKKDDFDF